MVPLSTASSSQYSQISESYTASAGAVDRMKQDTTALKADSVSKPKIYMGQLMEALDTTRPSLSLEERMRYEDLYAEFAGTSKEEKPKPRKLKSSLA